jgi:predicted alpha-1,2-mannosidase
MNKKLLLISAFSLLIVSSYAQSSKPKTSYVNPMIGTGGMGHTFPGACAPFGAVQLSPETDTIPHNIDGKYQPKVYSYCAGYQYDDKTIVGFSHTHLSGTGHSDLGDIMIMPQTGKLKLNPGTAANSDAGYRSRFSHNTEKSSVGYYEVMLDDYNVKAQLTATPRVGIHKYTFPKGNDCRLILDLLHGLYNYDGKVLWSSVRVENDTLLTGYRITDGWARCNYTYFAISFSKPITDYGYQDMKKPKYQGFWRKFDLHHNFPDMASRDLVAYFNFDNQQSQELTVKVALSAVSTEGALKNLNAEAAGKSFEQLYAETKNSWEKELSAIDCQGSDDQKAMIYTSFYHTMINPSIYMDVDRQYRGLDGNIHKAEGFDNYTIFSVWDTYRAEHPLLNLVKTDRNTNMVKSMIVHQQQSTLHMLPVWSLMGNEGWCMTGYHAVSVVADAIAKGADINKDEALKAMVETSNNKYFGHIPDYIKYGYVTFDNDANAASNTLEYAFDDWTIYAAAKNLGNETVAQEYAKRALNYRNTFDTKVGFASPRYINGAFKKDLDPYQTYGEGFIEGNSWNFSFMAPHDVYGLIKQFGGEKPFLDKLNNLFKMNLPEKYYADNEDIEKECLVGGYVHGNEPSHHIPYLYAWTSTPWMTQYWMRTIMDQMYKNHIRGLSGNDDCGQMSAWYIFSAMGFYPVCPGSDQYVFGAPYLPYMKVTLQNGNTITIKAPKVSAKNRYVKSVKLNGRAYSKLYITHKDLTSGCTLEFDMSSTPNKKRGITTADKPYSLTDGEALPAAK